MAEETMLIKMPVGVSRWSDLRSGRYFFVDKTALLPKLFNMGDQLFLTRPRRMGKTLLCSMLKEWFTNGSKSFSGMAIDGKLQEEGGYPVINLSFFSMGESGDAAEFESDLCARLTDAYSVAGFQVSDCDGINSFKRLYRRLNKVAIERGKPLVFLIDEWDYPLSFNIKRPQVCAALQQVMRNFYGWLRMQPCSVRFILITGIMRYRETSLFTGQDIIDISMEPVVADLLGYTQADLTGKQFVPYIKGAAKLLGMTPSAVLDKLERYYGGFYFDKDAIGKVYCPFAVNRFFSAVVRGSEPKFESYWMKSSGAKYALASYLHDYPLSSQMIMELSDQRLEMSNDSLRAGYLLQDVTFEQILVIGGYFSIKAITADTIKAKVSSNRNYRCGITNQDVRNVFFPVLMSYLVSFKNADGSALSTALGQVKSALRQGDIAQLCLIFNKILGYVRDDLFKELESQDQGEKQALYQVPKPDLEAFYRTVLKLALSSSSIIIKDEVANNLWRSDLEATTEDQVYIFALKRLGSITKASIDKRLDDGEKQILERMSGNNPPQPELPQTMVVVAISDTYRRICAWCRFKLQRTAQGLVVVERHKELVAY